ncbi:MAG: hypothetical protein ACUZ8I_11430 [Candidatus Scalindua sp.]
MIYNNRHYPHPVLGIEDDINGNAQVKLKVSSDSENIILENSFILENDDLERLITEKKASYSLHLSCTATFYRANFISFKSLGEPIRIRSSDLNGEVEINYFVCAEESISQYKNKDRNDDYGNIEFSIKRGDILAYLGKGKFYANKTYQETTSVSSFMNINTDGRSKKPFYLDYSSEKVTIYLCQEDYEVYQEIKLKKFSSILHSSIVLPALMQIIQFMESDEALEYKNKTWHKILSGILEKQNENDPLILSQTILELPLARAFSSMKDLQTSF